jgi:hypothetical protein
MGACRHVVYLLLAMMKRKKNEGEENRGFEAGAERSFGDARPDWER